PPDATLSLHDALPIFTLKSWADNPSTPQDAIDGLLAKLQEDRAEFFVKTMLTGPAVKAAGRRRAKFKAGASVIAALTDVGPEYEDRKSTRLNSSHVKI